MTLVAELLGALPRGAYVEVWGKFVFVVTKHADGLHAVAAAVGHVDDVLPVIARELRNVIEQFGPIVEPIMVEA